MTKCKRCGVLFKPKSSTGRPPVYCSPGCRRATEYEIRRLDASLRYAERRLWQAEVDAVTKFGTSWEKAVAFWSAKVDELGEVLESHLDDMSEVDV